MKLLFDANLSHRLIKVLSGHYTTFHILDFFNHNTKDIEIWQLAQKENFTIVTNDEDFIKIMAAKGWPPKIVLLKTGNQSNNYLAELLMNKRTEIENLLTNEQTGMLVIR